MNFKQEKRNKYFSSDQDDNKSIKSNTSKLNESNLSIQNCLKEIRQREAKYFSDIEKIYDQKTELEKQTDLKHDIYRFFEKSKQVHFMKSQQENYKKVQNVPKKINPYTDQSLFRYTQDILSQQFVENRQFKIKPSTQTGIYFENNNIKLYNTIKDPSTSLIIPPTVKKPMIISEQHESSYLIKHKYLKNGFMQPTELQQKLKDNYMGSSLGPTKGGMSATKLRLQQEVQDIKQSTILHKQ